MTDKIVYLCICLPSVNSTGVYIVASNLILPPPPTQFPSPKFLGSGELVLNLTEAWSRVDFSRSVRLQDRVAKQNYSNRLFSSFH